MHCCLKGGHVAPKVYLNERAYWNTDIDFLISPMGVYGRPHIACDTAGIPINFVEENSTIFSNDINNNSIVVPNYLAVVGVICAKKAGVTIESVRRPLGATKVCRKGGC